MTDDKGAGKGHKKFKGYCVYHGNWWSDVKPGHYRCPECKIEAKNEERDGPYKIGDVFYRAKIYSEKDAIIANSSYVAGRKAERERCAKIAEGYFHARGRVVAKAIRGGQDEK
jgi:hypothetical protein